MFEKLSKKRRLLCPEITRVGASSFAQQDIFNSNNRIKTAARNFSRSDLLFIRETLISFQNWRIVFHQALKNELLWGDR
jgi:hypothetical protein